MWGRIGLAAVSSAATFVFAQQYVTTGRAAYLGLALAAQVTLVVMYVHLLQTRNKSSIFSVIKIAAVLLMFGYGVMTEPLAGRKIVGIFFAVAALYLL